MMTNNNIFRIKRESDIFEIVEDNRDKLVVVVFNYEIKNKLSPIYYIIHK